MDQGHEPRSVRHRLIHTGIGRTSGLSYTGVMPGWRILLAAGGFPYRSAIVVVSVGHNKGGVSMTIRTDDIDVVETSSDPLERRLEPMWLRRYLPTRRHRNSQLPDYRPRTRSGLSRPAMVMVYIFILTGGALRSVEAGCQNSLKIALKNVWLCAVISYSVALIGMVGLLVVTIAATRSVKLPSRQELKTTRWWAPFGGLTGGSAIFAMITVASSVGISTFNALIIAGQMFAGVAMDHFGVMGFPRRRINPQRILACAMIIVASYLMAKY